MKHSVTLDRCVALTRQPEIFGQFVDGYRSVQMGGQLPTLSDCLTGDLVPLLPQVNVFELTRPGYVSYRFSGTIIAQRLGMDPTGRNMLEFLAPESRAMAESYIRHLAEVPCGGYSQYENAFEGGRRTQAETLLLPITIDPDSGRRALITLNLVEPQPYDPAYQDATIIGSRWVEAQMLDIGFASPVMADMSDLYRNAYPGT